MTAFRLACVQMEPLIGEPERNRAATERWIREAAAAGARLVVLPEASVSGYVFADRAEALGYGEEVPGGTTSRLWCELAAELGVHVVGGVLERDGDRLLNAAVVVGPDGVLGVFHKAHLWNDERRIYDRNESGFPVFDTALGRIGVGICYDAWFPETFRSVALAGADLLVLPSNWVPVPGQPADGAAMAQLMCMTGAHSNQIFVAGASRVGVERGQPFIGRSVVVGPDGWPIAGPADPVAEGLLLADVDLIGSRAERWGNPFNQPVADRRPELYRSGAAERPDLA